MIPGDYVMIGLVITEVVMPRMSGKARAERLKATCPGLNVLFTPGYTDEAVAERSVLEPGTAFLRKQKMTINQSQ